MIKIKAVNTTGMFSFGMMPTVPLQDLGMVFLRGINETHGGSNGSGKSSFINAIKEILFAQNDTNESGPNIVNKHSDWGGGCFGAIWFDDHQNTPWRVFLVRKWNLDPLLDVDSENTPSEIKAGGGKYTGTDLFLERWDGVQWKDERATSIGSKRFSDTQVKLINDVLKITYDQFSSYVCLGQQAESVLVNGTSGEREKIIQAITNVEIWDKASTITNAEIGLKESEFSQIKIKADILCGVIQSFTCPTEADRVHIRNTIDSAMATRMRLLSEITKHNENVDKWKAELGSVTSLTAERVRLVTHEREIRSARFIPPDVPSVVKELDDQIVRCKYEIATHTTSLDKQAKLGVGTCATCGQSIHQDHLTAEKMRLWANINIANNSLKSLENDRNKRINEFNTQVKQLSDEFYTNINTKLEVATTQLNVVETKLQANRSIESKIEEAKSACGMLINQISINDNLAASQTKQLEMLDKQIADHNVRLGELGKLNQQLAWYLNHINHLKWVERNFKKVKLQEYTQAIVRLNQLLNEQLQLHWGPGMSVSLVTSQDKAGGKGVKHGLNIVVSTENKEDLPIKLCSGGERKSIIISMFKAVRLLMREHGHHINIMAIDEIDKDLDDIHTDKLVDAFESFVNEADTCFIISHNSRLLNTMNFKSVWTIRNSNEMTRLEM